MEHKPKLTARWCFGWGFIVIGIAGLFLPLLQGVLFILIGLSILSTEYAWAKNLFQRLRSRFPAAAKQFDSVSSVGARWFTRFICRQNVDAGLSSKHD